MSAFKFKRAKRFFGKETSEEIDYYSDDPEDFSRAQKPDHSPLKFGVLTFISVLGVAFGANILLNQSNSGRLEFGQGYQVTTTCQGLTSPSVNLTLTPFAGFQNSSGDGKFSLDSILLENVDRACMGKDFTIKVFSDTSSAQLNLSDSATGGGSYATFSTFRFYWQDTTTVTSMSTQYTDVEFTSDTTDNTDTLANQTSFLITFDPDQVANYADARSVYKITIETNNHTS